MATNAAQIGANGAEPFSPALESTPIAQETLTMCIG
jgi:hypothetical protein